MYEWAAMGCNKTTSEELNPDKNCNVREGDNILQ